MADSNDGALNLSFVYVQRYALDRKADYIEEFLRLIDQRILQDFHKKTVDTEYLGFLKAMKVMRSQMVEDLSQINLKRKETYQSPNICSLIHDHLCAFKLPERDEGEELLPESWPPQEIKEEEKQ